MDTEVTPLALHSEEAQSPDSTVGKDLPSQMPADEPASTSDVVLSQAENQAKNDGPIEKLNEPSTLPPATQQADESLTAVSSTSASQRPSTDGPENGQALSSSRASTDMPTNPEYAVPQLQSGNEAAQSDMQEEMNAYIERIDTLQAKLQYLTREAVESARQAAAAAQLGSAEKKLLEKDEKIALLMEEGQNLSRTEMKHMTAIKKLRIQFVTSQKEHEAARLKAEKAERAAINLEDRARKAEAAARRAEGGLAASQKIAQDLEAVSRERNASNATLTEMRSQLAKANARAEAAETKAQSEGLEKERRKTAELQDDLTSAKVERELAEEKLKREVKDLQASLDREKQQLRALENEMLGEQAALESKLESFRARAEEASSGDHGDTQAKLLRQIETLQSQYAAASQNWQGIEGTLLARITNLEKERDEIVSREVDLRKKLRDATLKTKNNERQLEEMQDRYAESERNQAGATDELQRSARKIQQLEEELIGLKKDLDGEKAQAERDLTRRIEEEKAKWTASLHIPRTESPIQGLPSGRKGSTLDMVHLMSPVHFERAHSRRSSTMHGLDSNTPPRQYPSASVSTRAPALTNGALPETPSIMTSMDQDEYFANVPPTPVSQTPTPSNRGLNDLISTSTVGAGPSVQLVERMSANVRRLESEKAASKEELARLSTQRDEARQELVKLMREVEQKRNVEERIKVLEKEHEDLSQRHATTLELLGEKSEQVDELKADILDVKQMYRDLADHMK